MAWISKDRSGCAFLRAACTMSVWTIASAERRVPTWITVEGVAEEEDWRAVDGAASLEDG